mgnify:CR=1 FL=1
MAVKSRKKASSAPLPETYAELIALHVPRPIRDTVEYENTLEILDALAVLDDSVLTQDQADYMETLSLLAEAWEDEHRPIPETTGIEALIFLLEQHGMHAGHLGELLGARTYGYALLHGTRQLSKRDIVRLGEFFHVPAGIFLK